MSDAPLQLRWTGLPEGHSRLEGRVEFTALDAAEEDEAYDVALTADVDNFGSRIRITGRIEGHARSTCHRCLESFDRVVCSTLDLMLQHGGTAGAEDSDEILAIPATESVVDLTPWVREAVLLEEPIQLLCASDCRGLCSSCGANLNSGPCACGPRDDPRWAPLRELRLEP